MPRRSAVALNLKPLRPLWKAQGQTELDVLDSRAQETFPHHPRSINTIINQRYHGTLFLRGKKARPSLSLSSLHRWLYYIIPVHCLSLTTWLCSRFSLSIQSSLFYMRFPFLSFPFTFPASPSRLCIAVLDFVRSLLSTMAFFSLFVSVSVGIHTYDDRLINLARCR